jgi:hypothetical protein
VSLLDRFKGKSSPPGAPKAPPKVSEVDLAELSAHFARVSPTLESKKIEPELMRARLADRLRDVDVDPLAPEFFSQHTRDLDAEAWRRLALALSALDLPNVRDAQRAALTSLITEDHARLAFFDFARQANLLTLELLRQSPLRLEEFTRRWIFCLGASIKGENTRESAQKLERLDYGRLLSEAERAKKAADERADYLRKLQEEQDKKLAPRGKF